MTHFQWNLIKVITKELTLRKIQMVVISPPTCSLSLRDKFTQISGFPGHWLCIHLFIPFFCLILILRLPYQGQSPGSNVRFSEHKSLLGQLYFYRKSMELISCWTDPSSILCKLLVLPWSSSWNMGLEKMSIWPPPVPRGKTWLTRHMQFQ